MRLLLIAACLLLLLPAATAGTEPNPIRDDAYCQHATADDPVVFQAGCWRGSIYCQPWFSVWNPVTDRPDSYCTL